MERDDGDLLSLIGEDDSLLSLQHSPNDTVSSFVSTTTNNTTSSSINSLFSCSPLLRIPRSTSTSTITPIISEENTSKRSCPSFNEDNNINVSKENVNINKQEGPKLSIEPQQMKRKKKGGGYNLRKSLAWDRAFFTDEGVLDPLELSMLSGNLANGKPNGEMLSVISEGRESLSGDFDNADDHDDSNKSTPNHARKMASFSPKLGSPARYNKTGPPPAAKRKVLAAHDINRSASKRNACPRPVASTSLKRPPNTNTTKVVTKDSKVSKLSAPRPDPSVVSTSSSGSITSAGHSKSNLISQSGNAQRNVGLKGRTSNTKMTKNDANSGPSGKLSAKSSTQTARRNVVKVTAVPEKHSSTRVQLPQVSQAKNSLEVLPDSVVPMVHPPYGHDGNTRNVAAFSSQNAFYNDGNMKPTQTQIAKPSGLRMPSPSMGFFGQSKSSGSHSLLQRAAQPCSIPKSNIPNFSKANVLNSIQQRPPKPSGSLPVQSSTSHSVASIVNGASNEKIKSNLQSSSMQKAALDYAASFKNKKSSCTENKGLQSNGDKLPLQSGPREQLEKNDDRSVIDVRDSSGSSLDNPHLTSHISLPVEVKVTSEINIMSVNQLVKDMHCNPYIRSHSVCPESQSAEIDNFEVQPALEAHESQLSGMHEVQGWSSGPVELIKLDTCTFDVENQSLSGTLLEDIRSSIGLSKGNSSNNADILLEVQEGGRTSCPSLFTDAESTKDGTSRFESDCLSRQLLSVEGNLLVESGESLMNTSALVSSNLMKIDNPSAKSVEQDELLNPCIVEDQNFHDKHGSVSNDCLLSERYSESKEKIVLQADKAANYLCSVALVNQDRGFDESGKVEYLQVENSPMAFVDCEPGVENFRHDVKLCDEANTSVVERMDRSEMFEAVITGRVENCLAMAQNSPIMQVKVSSGKTNKNDSDCAIDEQFQKNFIPFIDSQPENEACHRVRHTDMLHSDCSTGMDDVKEQNAEQEKLINACSDEAKQVNLSPGVCDGLLGGKSISFENISAVGVSGSENLQSPQECEILENELAGVDSGTENVLMGDALEPSLDESMLSDGCNSISNKQNESSLVVGDKTTEPAIEQFPLENNGLCLNDNLLLIDTTVELQEKDTVENVTSINLEQCTVCPSKSKSSDALPPITQDVSRDLDKNVPDLLSMELSIENVICYNVDSDHKNDYEVDNQTSPSNFVSSSMMNGDQMPLAQKAFDSKPICSLNDKTNETSTGSTEQSIQEDLLECSVLPVEAESNIHQSNGSSNSTLLDGLDSVMCSKEDDDASTSLKSANDKRPDELVIRPPLNAVPFSEEWLAAFEVAGEEILARKGGAVQNSPPDKSVPEPGPWSPVRRKNNQGIGPYDCTKFINANNPSLTSN